MALPKRIKVGGAYYKGSVCVVASSSGLYTAVITNTSGAAVNGISIVPDAYGSGDTMKLEHKVDSAGTGATMAILAESINNVGAGAVIALDFPSAELVQPTESLVFTYINTASVAMNVYLITEFVGIKKTT